MEATYTAAWLSWILIPVVCWLLPVVAIVMLMFYVEGDAA
ncbi:MAG: photosystem I reaction center subunit VIII [Cyanobacteria bacterium J06598_3]